MLYREIIAVCFNSHTGHIHTLCGQNVRVEHIIVRTPCAHNYCAARGRVDKEARSVLKLGICVNEHVNM
jgi:hypothetical protein